ncbi:nucleotide sugar dehydrogenase [Halorubrum sp. Ib24]|uniref:nucleotide sugar dehydrogenase n=1 Tax=Halorubrum sp. Ib24 TaxID=1383850 RepID=UPI000B988392|nr:nucleotide sugar dehydrogenase [Halorubrum sp. Ib24]OYR38150.1 nucleotide sugar dehydrogenase [Halorubrum sp. Ib24]
MTRPTTKPGSLYDADRSDEELRALVDGRNASVAVYGLGKMGLPLATVYAGRVGDVVGVDVDESVVDSVNRGDCHIDGEPGLPETVAEAVGNDALRATTDARAAAERATVHVVIVPTPITHTKEPDLSIFDTVIESVAHGLSPGDTVFVECTVPPGTCRDRLVPTLVDRSGLSADEFGAAFCPERTSSGRALEDITGAYPKVVGGVDDESARVAEFVYGNVTDNDVIRVSDATTAEAVKLFEGLYRDVNIALANELGTLADDLGIDVREAADAANTQPFCHLHSPGAGVGGHCIPWYPYFVMSRVDTPTPLLRTAREVNDSMPSFTAGIVERELAERGTSIEGSRVLVLGVTYRPGVKETRATPAGPLITDLKRRGAETLATDPMLDDETISSFGAEPLSLAEVGRSDPDAVVVVTPHEAFDGVEWDGFDDVVVVDGRDTLGDIGHPTYTIGSGRN